MKIPEKLITRIVRRALEKSTRAQEILVDWAQYGWSGTLVGPEPVTQKQIDNAIRRMSRALYLASDRLYSLQKIKAEATKYTIDGFVFILWPVPAPLKEQLKQFKEQLEQETE